MKSFLRKIIPDFIFGWYHFGWALLGAIVYRFPSKKLKVIGVTGTNGKSTVVFFISRILEEAGYSVAALSSIQFKIKDKIWPNTLKMTMPGRMKIQKFLRDALRAGCQYVVLEVTSEGIKQYRHKFIGFDLAVLTNLTAEHLESHGGFDNYKKAKGKLFRSLKANGKSVINLDDSQADYFRQFPAKEKIGYTINSKPEFTLNLLGRFNISNALAAIAVAQAEGVPLAKIKTALGKIKSIPGRMEIVIKESFTPHLSKIGAKHQLKKQSLKGAGFTVIVDYAHTPDALEKVYQTVKEISKGRLIGVLGAAGGGRDKWKRPALGKIAEQYLDKIIITNEDPYDEDPRQILSEIKSGSPRAKEILDRREAIRKAISLAKPGDVVIITGKGCEPWMCLAKGRKIPWDDREVVREEFLKRL